MDNRRTALKTLAVLAGAAVTTEAQEHQHSTSETGSKTPVQNKPKLFSEGEIRLLTVLTNLIIPASDTPGAGDAGVPYLIDSAAARAPKMAEPWRELFAYFHAESQRRHNQQFVDLTEKQQVAILTEISTEKNTAGARHFKLLKDQTIDLYYSTRVGLETELGWHGNTYLSEWKGCTHPEHQS